MISAKKSVYSIPFPPHNCHDLMIEQYATLLLELTVYASYLEILRCMGVMAYYFYIIIDPTGVQPNRLFMLVIYSSSATFWSVYIISHIDAILDENTRKSSKMKQISAIQVSSTVIVSQ
uniref:Uncharacterized protein n=1 Tax=Onchocerca volvulus TaxID=6282 RepID=A0A8R1U2J6_ONCVO